MDLQRPLYHFLPLKNWMNDPNGLIQLNGEYHMFYQHNPFAAIWGNMTWGHAVSKDMLHWEHLPFALYPDKSYDKDGVFSGCAVNDNDEMTILYTGVKPEVQCLAFGGSDGRSFRKYEGNPVISAPPEEIDAIGFRDPYVWKHDGIWYMVVGSGIRGVGGTLPLYTSTDLKKWDYVHPILVGDKDETGVMWECPSIFKLGDKWVMVVSATPPISRTIYYVGTFEDLKFIPEYRGEIDLGGSLYAPQVFQDEKDRQILFGWLKERRAVESQVAAGWAGVMTLPRVLSLGSKNQLEFAVAEEVSRLRSEQVCHKSLSISDESPHILKVVQGDSLEILAEIALDTADAFGLKVRCSPDGEEETLIIYDRQTCELIVDGKHSSTDTSAINEVRSSPLNLAEGEPLKLHVFIDRSVLEIFANDRTCLTVRIYPSMYDSTGIGLFARGGTVNVLSLDVWRLSL